MVQASTRRLVTDSNLVSAILSSTQANSTVTPAVLTGHTFSIPPGMTLRLTGQMIFRSAATTTGAALGIRVTQPSGASANAIGSCAIQVANSAVPAATALENGTSYNVAANANTLFEVVGTDVSSTSVDHVANYQAIVKNLSAAHITSVTVEFRSEVGASAVTAQIGTGGSGIITL